MCSCLCVPAFLAFVYRSEVDLPPLSRACCGADYGEGRKNASKGARKIKTTATQAADKRKMSSDIVSSLDKTAFLGAYNAI